MLWDRFDGRARAGWSGVARDLPGVGENSQGPLCDSYQEPAMFLTCIYADHNALSVPYLAVDEAQTLNAIFRNDEGGIVLR